MYNPGVASAGSTFGASTNNYQQSPTNSSERYQLGGEQYARLELRDQIRLRPDTYIGGSVGVETDSAWTTRISQKGTLISEYLSVQYPKAMMGVIKEMFDNAADNVIRSRTEKIDPGIIEITKTDHSLTVKNYGKHIPVVVHHKERVWTPYLIFGVLLTSDNYNDSIDRYKVGRNGYGIKLANIFSTMFVLSVGDPVLKLKYNQTWRKGMLEYDQPTIEENYTGPGFTEVTIYPDFAYFYENPKTKALFLDAMEGIFLNRTIETSYAVSVPVKYNGVLFRDYIDAPTYFKSHFEAWDSSTNYIHWKSEDGCQEILVGDTPGKGWTHAFVNGTPVNAGVHVNEYTKCIFQPLIDEFEKKYKKKVTIVHLRKHISMLLKVMVINPKFNNQSKDKLVKPTPKVNIPIKICRDTVRWPGVTEELKKQFNLKEKKEEKRIRYERVPSVSEALKSDSGDPTERLKCTLILTEGETGKTLAMKGCAHLPGGNEYIGVYPLRGKVMNVQRHKRDRVDANKVLNNILKILNADRDVDYHKEPKKCLTLRYGKIGLMMDADTDGFHIAGLLINFIFTTLKSLAPFDFIIIIMTPVVEAWRGAQRLAFYHIKELNRWIKENQADVKNKLWDFKYKKGLGSWNTDDKTLARLFKNPMVITMDADPDADDIIRLAFDSKLTDERKRWISDYNPESELNLRTPRPITEFFTEEFRDYSKSAVIRAIPRLMDGMKPVHRKIIYTLFRKFPTKTKKKRKFIRVPQIAGSVMEMAGYHHGEQALFDSIVGMGQCYITGPNNLTVVEGEGNFGDRRVRGMDQSPSRYLNIRLHDVAYAIYPKEDRRLWDIQYEDGVAVEPKEMYPVIPMALVNKCEGVGTGWNCKIFPHDPRKITEWVVQWVKEMKTKRDIPRKDVFIDVSTKPELVPWWRDYTGKLIRVKNTPYESYVNEGSFHYQFHTVYITEIPAETSIEDYIEWGNKEVDLFHESPELAKFRYFKSHGISPKVDFRIAGMSNPTLDKLNLSSPVSMSRLTLIDKEDHPKTFAYSFEIMTEWCMDRLAIYTKRKNLLVSEAEEKMKMISLKYNFVMDVVEGRLELRGRSKAEIIPYMMEKGYPCGGSKKPKKGRKKKTEKKEDDEDEDGEEDNDIQAEVSVKEEMKNRQNRDFLTIPINSITKERAEKLRSEFDKIAQELDYYRTVWEEDLWLHDLEVLKVEIDKVYSVPLY